MEKEFILKLNMGSNWEPKKCEVCDFNIIDYSTYPGNVNRCMLKLLQINPDENCPLVEHVCNCNKIKESVVINNENNVSETN